MVTMANDRCLHAIFSAILATSFNNANIDPAYKTISLCRGINNIRYHTLKFILMEDGMIYLATPQDILFHVLPHLKTLTSHHSLPSQDILDALPPPLPKLTPPQLIHAICDCTESTNSLIPDTYKLSMTRILNILSRKVDALIPVLGESILAEYVEKPLSLVIGQEPPENILQILELAKRKCAMEIIS